MKKMRIISSFYSLFFVAIKIIRAAMFHSKHLCVTETRPNRGYNSFLCPA